ncbi:hypothetical protein GCK32_020058, partial [Trichostrongylus colubriformis]
MPPHVEACAAHLGEKTPAIFYDAAAATPRFDSTGLLGLLKRLLAAAKRKISKIALPEGKSSLTECYDQVPEECSRLYEKGVCSYEDVAKEYCRVTCGFCRPKNYGSRSEGYIMSDEWDKIPNGLQPPSRANHSENLG